MVGVGQHGPSILPGFVFLQNIRPEKMKGLTHNVLDVEAALQILSDLDALDQSAELTAADVLTIIDALVILDTFRAWGVTSRED